MKLSFIGLFLAGVAAAVGAAVLVGALRVGNTTRAAEPVKNVKFALAARDLKEMTVIGKDDIVVETAPRSDAPPDGLSPTAIIGKTLAIAIPEGMLLTRDCFAEGTGMRLASMLEPGTRAVTVRLPGASGMEGLLYPGCRVDVLASFAVPGRGGVRREAVSVVLLEGVMVLGVENQTVVSPADDEGKQGSSRYRLVTLKVDLKQAESLQLATTYGEVSLAMRNPHDTGSADGEQTHLSHLSRKELAELVGAEIEMPVEPRTVEVPAPTTAEPPDNRWNTVVIRGATRKTQRFEESQAETEQVE